MGERPGPVQKDILPSPSSPVDRQPNRFSRRSLLKGAAAAVGAYTLRGLARPDIAQGAEAVGTLGLELPVLTDRPDPRLEAFDQLTLHVTSSVKKRTGPIKISGVSPNITDYPGYNAENRINMVGAQALARMWTQSLLVDGDDFSPIKAQLTQPTDEGIGVMPQDPDYEEFRRRGSEEGKDFEFLFMALGQHDKVDFANVSPRSVKPALNILARLVNTPGLITFIPNNDGSQLFGGSFRVSDQGRLIYDMYFGNWDLSSEDEATRKSMYQSVPSILLKNMNDAAVMTMGGFDTFDGNGAKYANWWNEFIIKNYYGKWVNQGGTIIPAMGEMILGSPSVQADGSIEWLDPRVVLLDYTQTS